MDAGEYRSHVRFLDMEEVADRMDGKVYLVGLFVVAIGEKLFGGDVAFEENPRNSKNGDDVDQQNLINTFRNSSQAYFDHDKSLIT